MIFSRGFVYRLGVRIKDFGERMACTKIFGIPALRWCCRPVINLGLAVRDFIMDRPVANFSGEK
ncbi:MAG: hypothetical protein LBF77_00055 [Spirochaetaceae bacterium]|nr:hypothetical protein [Spirochaetaceae bacterium]